MEHEKNIFIDLLYTNIYFILSKSNPIKVHHNLVIMYCNMLEL